MKYPYQNPALPVEERLDDLMKRLSPEEKIGQLCKPRAFCEFEKTEDGVVLKEEYREFSRKNPPGCVYGILRSDPWTKRNFQNGVSGKDRERIVRLFDEDAASRAVPVPLAKAEEAPHGLSVLEATVFPCGLAIGASFDRELAYEIGRAIGRETLACGMNTVYAPVLDIASDLRWSRVEECYGEDPALVTELGESCFRGIQETGVLALLKHYAGGGASENGLNQQPAHMGTAELYNGPLRPFRRCIAAGAKALMSTYHDVDGEPCTGSRYLLTDVLRGELGYKGFVTADGGAVERLYHLRLANSLPEAAARALKAGCDMESGHSSLAECGKMLRDALREGLIAEADLDLAARRVLRVKFEMGWFDKPVTFDSSVLRSPAHRELALRAAHESIVMVKNNGVLPLKMRRIALTGPNAANAMNQLGDYTAFQRREAITTVFDALKAEPGCELRFEQGCRIRSMNRSGFAAAVAAAEKSDCCIAVLGGSSWHDAEETVDPVTGAVVGAEGDTAECSEKESGEGTDRASLNLCGVQLELLRELKKTGKPLIAVLIEGRPLQIDEILKLADAVLIAFYPGEAGGRAIADILTGRVNPSGRLPVSVPYSAGQLPVNYNSAVDRKGRFYLDSPAFPALEFGFGLSYTTFEYSRLVVEGRQVRVTAANTGDRAGEEVAQFYLTAHGDAMQRPWCELCHFERLFLNPGESRELRFALTDEMLYRYDRSGTLRKEVRKFTVRAGGNLRDVLTADCEIV